MTLWDSLTVSIISAIIGFGSAAVVMVSGHLLSRFFLDPLCEIRKVVTELDAAGHSHIAGLLTAAPPRDLAQIRSAVTALVALTSKLVTMVSSLPFYETCRKYRLVPFPKRVMEMHLKCASLLEIDESPAHIPKIVRVMIYIGMVTGGKDFAFDGPEMDEKLGDYFRHLADLMRRDFNNAVGQWRKSIAAFDPGI